ncbi:hypothetical protein ES703_17733 [subsurface metagenome]
MNEEAKQSIKIKLERFHFSVRLGSLFFPLEVSEVTPLLEESGYKISEELTKRLADLPLGTKLVVGGAIAEKRDDGKTFRMEPDRGVIAIAGQHVGTIVEDFSNLEKLIKDKLNVSLEREALFYEFTAEGTATTGKDPTKIVAKLLNGSRLQSEISKILGSSVTSFGLRLVERERYVTDNQWFDFKIEPLIPKPDTTYHINVVYRHPKRANVINAAQSLNGTIEKLLIAIEGE